MNIMIYQIKNIKREKDREIIKRNQIEILEFNKCSRKLTKERLNDKFDVEEEKKKSANFKVSNMMKK